MIHHSIDLTADARPVYQSVKRYTPREREFVARIFPEMEEAGIITRAASDWEARSQFPPRKKESDQPWVVHNFIAVNKYTIKPQYPMHRIDEVIDTIIKPKFTAKELAASNREIPDDIYEVWVCSQGQDLVRVRPTKNNVTWVFGRVQEQARWILTNMSMGEDLTYDAFIEELCEASTRAQNGLQKLNVVGRKFLYVVLDPPGLKDFLYVIYLAKDGYIGGGEGREPGEFFKTPISISSWLQLV